MSARTGTTVYTIVATTLLATTVLAPDNRSTAHAQVLPPIQDTLRRPIDRGLDRVDRTGSRIQRRVEEADDELEEPVDEMAEDGTKAPSAAVEDAGQTVRDATDTTLNTTTANAGQAVQGAAGVAATPLRPFVLDADPMGWPIEKNTVVTLLDDQALAAVMQSGIDVVSRRDLHTLGLTLIAFRDRNRPALRALDDFRQAYPDVAVDFNHVYRFASEAEPAPASGAVGAEPRDQDKAIDNASLRVGMIDSAVFSEHPALRDSRVVSHDFVTHEGARPLGHGTAVASLIARSAADEAEIHAASVFFQAPGYAPGATTESLVAALDWLASQRVDAINMSLAGPANALLEEALTSMSGTSPVVIAAVGNNGPSGEPLYPAAYDGVIGVTAVDREQKIFLYANRGEHVDYAALGVGVKVADSRGSWRVESGTSMASPHVAVVIARMRHASDISMQALLDALTANAEDLGEKGFDRLFGYGLITDPPVLISRSHQEFSEPPAGNARQD